MNRFAELLDRLAYEPGRNNKLRLMTDYFRSTPDPERGYALAALTGSLTFQYAKPGMIRGLITERADPLLFALSRDFVGDTSETIALMWPVPDARPNFIPSISDVVTGLNTQGKAQLPAQIARWLDALDETGRWALLKLVMGALRVGVSARLAKTAAAALGDTCSPGWKAAARSRNTPTRLHSGRRCWRRPSKLLTSRSWIPPTSWPNGNGTASACRRRRA